MASQNYMWSYEFEFTRSLFTISNNFELIPYDQIYFTMNDLSSRGLWDPEGKLFLTREVPYVTKSYPLMVSNDHGYTWQRVNTTLPFYYQLSKIDFCDYQHGIATANYRTKTTQDGGITWQTFSASQEGNLIDLSYPSPLAAYRRLLYQDTITLSYSHIMQKSTNQGQSWVNITVPGSVINKMIFTSATKGFVFGADEQTGEGGFYSTSDGGNNWNWNLLNIAAILKADMVNDSLGYIYIADQKLYRLVLNSNGIEITQKSLPVGISVRNFKFSDEFHGILLANDTKFSKVFWTNQGADSWNEINALLPIGLDGIKMGNNLLSAYVFGNGNNLFWIDDGLPLGMYSNKSIALNIQSNPAQDFIHVAAEHLQGMLEIHDISGKLFYRGYQQLPAGVYILTVKTATQNLHGKFIKQ